MASQSNSEDSGKDLLYHLMSEELSLSAGSAAFLLSDCCAS